MPHPDAPPLTRGVVLRAAGFAVAVALGAVAVWLIVMADSIKSIQVGVLAGIWGAVLAAMIVFSGRRPGHDDEPARSVSDVPVLSAQEIALRSGTDVERVAEAAARRAFEDRLEQMLRREIGREVSDLRSEIARLRQDLLDKVGGQLRLERIETTRVIGSDLEALQHEVRQLKQASETGALHELGLGTSSVRTVVEPATVRPISRPSAEAAADVKPARVADEPAVENVPVVDVAAADAAPEAARAEKPRVEMPPAEKPRAETPPAERPRAEAPPAEKPQRPSSPARGTESVRQPAPSAAWSPPVASSNGAARNGAARRPAERDQASAPEPAETTGPIQLEPPDGVTRPDPPSTAARATHRPAGPTPVEPAVAWTPPVPPARKQPAERPAASRAPEPVEKPSKAVTPPQAAKPATPPRAEKPAAPAAAAPAPAAPTPAAPAPAAEVATPPAEKRRTPPPAAVPAPSMHPSAEDPFASLPRITPFTEFELEPVDTAPPSHRTSAAVSAGPASPVVPANPAYTGRRRRTDGGGDPDAGRHSRSEPVAAVPDAGGGRRRRIDEDDDEDLLSRLLARGSAEH